MIINPAQENWKTGRSDYNHLMFIWVSMIFVFIGMAIYGLVHSWLASMSLKGWIKRLSPSLYEKYYRLIYTVTSILFLLPILALVYFLPDQMIYRIPAPWVYLTLLIQGIAGFLALLAFRGTDVASFLGLRQVFQPAPVSDTLQTGGLYRFVRHPIYSLGIVIIWLFPWMTTNLFAFFLSSTLYLVIGAIFEERKLLRQFDKYAEYQKEVPMFIPRMRR